MASTRSKTDTYLLGSTENTITGSKLPSRKQVLQLFLHHHLEEKMTLKDAAGETLKVLGDFWQRARIPMQKDQRAKEKILRLYEEWARLKKNKSRTTKTQKDNEKQFVNLLENLFDIAHANAMSMIELDEDKEFLKAQREKGRRGSMVSRDMVLANIESRRRKRDEEEQNRERKSLIDEKKIKEVVQFSSSSSSTSSPEKNFEEADYAGPSTSQMPPSKRTRASKKIMNSELSAAMHRTLTTEVSDMILTNLS